MFNGLLLHKSTGFQWGKVIVANGGEGGHYLHFQSATRGSMQHMALRTLYLAPVAPVVELVGSILNLPTVSNEFLTVLMPLF